MSYLSKFGCFAVLALCLSLPAAADTRIAVLDFELNDFTSNPGVPEEVQRTASLQGLLQQSLSAKTGYQVVAVDSGVQKTASPGYGYLWDHPDEAAALGRLSGSRFVVVGRVSKPSFLFVHLTARLIDVSTRQIAGEFVVEVKGQQQNFTGKGVDNLARQIDEKLRAIADGSPT